jgi:NADP-dependent 3-hydroxy acid dehydrogenase YdfG
MNKLVLVTGATSGIGKACAAVFAQHGHDLIITGRREDRLRDLAEHLEREYHIQVRPLLFDVRVQDEVDAALGSLGEEVLEKVDILINNAGLAKGLDPVYHGRLDHWETMIDTNIKGLLYVTRFITPYMVNKQAGHVINVGSIAGKEAYPNGAVYCATKAAVDALTKGMRMDLYTHGIRVSQVSPGHVEETEFARVRFDGDEQRARIYDDFQPLRSSDVADIVYFMATRPSHVNIQDVLVMGSQQASATMVDRSGRQ